MIWFLLNNGLKFRVLKLLGRPAKPWYLELAVTNRCNSRCTMCNIWRLQQWVDDPRELEPDKEELIDVLSSPLFSELVELVITGGEPLLRTDLAELAEEIMGLKARNLTNLQTIVLVTNGFLSRRLCRFVEDVAPMIREARMELTIVCSLDGVGKSHDIIRGIKNAFRRVDESIQQLKELRGKYDHLRLGVKTTIMPQNIDELDKVTEYVRENDLFLFISPVIFSPVRFRNPIEEERLNLRPEQEEKLIQFYSRGDLGIDYGHQKLLEFYKDGKRTAPCTAAFNFLFIDADSQVYPCAVFPRAIQSFRKQDIAEIWRCEEVSQIRKTVGHFPICETCTELGAIRSSLLLEGFRYLRFLFAKGLPQALREAYWNKGLQKYLG